MTQLFEELDKLEAAEAMTEQMEEWRPSAC